MAPRKSNASITNPAEESQEPKAATTRTSMNTLGVEDLTLPRSLVQRLAKGMLPANTNMTKDSLLALSKSATVFINYIAASAGEHASQAGRKTIQANHVVAALRENEFEALIGRVEAEVERFNELQTDKRNLYKQKLNQKMNRQEGGDVGTDAVDPQTNGRDVSGDDRPTKKVRRDDGTAASAVNGEHDGPDGDDDGGDEGGEPIVDEDGEEDEDEDQASGVESESEAEVSGVEGDAREQNDDDDDGDADGDVDRIDGELQDEALDDNELSD